MSDRIAAMHEDDRMVRDFLAGDSGGLERVYGAYGTFLYSIARSVLSSDEDAQDCVHDALLRLWQHSKSYRSERGALRTYLAVSVRNEALTRKRDAARHLRIEERAARDDLSDYGLEVDDHVDRAHLRQALAALPVDQRTAIELAYFGELTHVEIAQRLSLPLGTTKSRVALGLRKLGAAMREPAAGTP